MSLKSSLAIPRWVAAGTVAAGAFVLFFFRLGGTPLLDPDEPVYGQIAREMARSGHWLTPHLAGRPWFDKPPLFYWASAAAMTVFGPTELAARLPSALAAVLLAALVYALGRHLFGRSESGKMGGGGAAVLVLATSLETIILGRAAVTDMLFALTLTAALAAFALWYQSIQGRASGLGTGPTPFWAALCGVALGLAVLCKGPVAVVLLGGTALIFLLWERQARLLLSAGAWVAILCCLLVAGPWYVAMLALNRREFVGQFIVANNLQRFARPEHAQGLSPFYFVPVLMVGLFPWSLFLPRAVAAGRRVWAGRLLIVWAALVFLFFSVSSTKLVTYIYPLYPAAALLIGPCLEGDLSTTDERGKVPRSPLHSAAWMTAALSLLLVVGLVWVARRQYPAALPGAAAMGAALLAGTAWGVGSARKGGTPLPAYGATMVAVAAALAGLIVPQIAPAVSLRELAVWAQTTHRPLVAYRLRTPGFLFYTGRELPDEHEPAALAERARTVPGLAVAMSQRSLRPLKTATPGLDWRVIWHRGNRVVAEPVLKS